MTTVIVANPTGLYDRTEAAALLTSIGCWHLPQHLRKLASTDVGPRFKTDEHGAAIYAWRDLLDFAATETEARRQRRAERRVNRSRR